MIYQTFEIECDRCAKIATVRIPLRVDNYQNRKPRQGKVFIKVDPNDASATSKMLAGTGFREYPNEHLCGSCSILRDELEKLNNV